MFPSSFASMIIKIVLPHVVELLVPIKNDVSKHSQYVNEPNDADIRLDKVEEQIKMLAEDQHPPVIDLDEWADVKETIKKIKRKKAFKSLNG